MKIRVYLPESYEHDHFELVVTRKLQSGELSRDDKQALEYLSSKERKIARRLAKLDAQQ